MSAQVVYTPAGTRGGVGGWGKTLAGTAVPWQHHHLTSLLLAGVVQIKPGSKIPTCLTHIIYEQFGGLKVDL